MQTEKKVQPETQRALDRAKALARTQEVTHAQRMLTGMLRKLGLRWVAWKGWLDGDRFILSMAHIHGGVCSCVIEFDDRNEADDVWLARERGARILRVPTVRMIANPKEVRAALIALLELPRGAVKDMRVKKPTSSC